LGAASPTVLVGCENGLRFDDAPEASLSSFETLLFLSTFLPSVVFQ
jgi:hypothetical protein